MFHLSTNESNQILINILDTVRLYAKTWREIKIERVVIIFSKSSLIKNNSYESHISEK
jgi:hypothetical protein